MPENKELKETTKTYMKKYYEKHGIGGLLGIIIEIDEEKVDKKDVENHRAAFKVEEQAQVTNYNHIQEFKTPSNFTEITESGMYKQEALPAVLDDLTNIGQSIIVSDAEQNVQEQPKKKVLSNQIIPIASQEAVSTPAPNPWEDAEVVSPGHIKL